MPNIVMTGGTSGFGAIAATHLHQTDGVRLILGTRRAAASPGPADAIPLDLANLASVRAFADALHHQLDAAPVHTLILNAGLVRADADARTTDGYETTFAVNHLAQYLLLRLLLPTLADQATVLLTTSGTHDPAIGADFAPPRHADANLLAHPDRDPGLHANPRKAGQHAYSASKLCAVLTAASVNAGSLTAGPATSRSLTAIAYDPGEVFGTGLAANLSLPMRTAWSILGSRPLRRPMRRFNPHFNTPSDAGAALAELALGRADPPPGHTYAALRHGRLSWPQPSELARDADAARQLWAASAGLVSLPQ